MTWLDGLPTIICEDCGHILPPELATWYQGEVAICKDAENCKHRKEELNLVQEKLDQLKKEVGDRCMIDSEATPMPIEPFPTISLADKNPNRYQDKARHLVLNHYNEHFMPVGTELHISEVYVTSFTKTLQNWKALIATEVFNDGLYFEVTYNGDKNQSYINTYKKVSNTVVHDTELKTI